MRRARVASPLAVSRRTPVGAASDGARPDGGAVLAFVVGVVERAGLGVGRVRGGSGGGREQELGLDLRDPGGDLRVGGVAKGATLAPLLSTASVVKGQVYRWVPTTSGAWKVAARPRDVVGHCRRVSGTSAPSVRVLGAGRRRESCPARWSTPAPTSRHWRTSQNACCRPGGCRAS